jgi:RNA polymerase sigma-70 factor (ECF subfamily)
MNAPQDEQKLLERSRHGDLEAFNALVVAYQDRVYNLCLRMLGSVQPAEDAAQEAFISAFRNVAKMRGENVRAWLFRIASNACIDELRRRKRQPHLSLDAPPRGAAGDAPDRRLDVPDAAAGPEQLLLRGELGEALQVELLRLPAGQRLAVVLCDIEGLSYEEIAASMSSSLGTVKSRISRGRARLREALEARPELFGDILRHTERDQIAL